MWNNNNNNYQFTRPSMMSPQNYTPSPYQPLQSSNNSPSYQQSQSVHSQNNLIWVMGKENARSMQLQPNSTLVMLDSEANKFYIKTTDDIGLGRLRVFNYTQQNDLDPVPTNNQVKQPDLSNYVTKEELNKIITTLKGDIKQENESSISTIKSTKTTNEF